MFDITSRLNVTRTLGSTVMLGTMLFLSSPAAYAAVPSPTLSLKANPATVSTGGEATLSWTSQNTQSCTASGDWSGKKSKSGYQTVKNITSSRTYQLTCAGTTKKVSATVKVAVIATLPPPAPPPPMQPIVGLVPSPHLGTFDAAGKAFTNELGAHSIRTGYSHGDHDGAINWAAQNGKLVVLMLGYGEGCDVLTESGRQCYANRSAGLVQKYDDKVQYWEVWNEWDGGFGLGRLGWNKPPANNFAMYTDLLCKTYKAIKAVKPSAIVVGGAIAGANERFVNGMLDVGAGNCMDMFSQHYYVYRQNMPGHVPSDAPGSVGAKRFIEFMTGRENLLEQKTGRTIPILVTEAGFNGSNEQLAAEYLTELYERAKTVPFIEGIWWYQLEDTSKGTFGLVRRNNTKKPAFAAFKAAAE